MNDDDSFLIRLPSVRHRRFCNGCPDCFLQPLKVLSLQCIVTNFPKFFQAYKESTMQYSLEFLQRRYSKELLEELTEIDEMKVEYLPFLLNRYLKELDLSTFFPAEPQDVCDRLKYMGSSLTRISLAASDNWEENQLVELVSLLPNCEILQLGHSNCSDSVLKRIGECCNHLLTLDISGCYDITDDGIKNLIMEEETGNVRKNLMLKWLSMEFCNITSFGINLALRHIPSLTSLHIEHLAEVIYEENAADFANGFLDKLPSYNLTELEVSNFSTLNAVSRMLADVLSVCAAVCPHITFLEIEGPVDSSVTKACINFKAVKDVKFTVTKEKVSFDVFVPFFKERGKQLSTLLLHKSDLAVEELAKMCPNLKSLFLEEILFTNIENPVTPAAIQSLKLLKKLVIDGADLGDNVCSASVCFLVSNSPIIETLYLRFSESLRGEIIDTLLEKNCMQNLLHFDASFSDMDAESAAKLLLALPKLTKFRIENIQIIETDYEYLVELAKSHRHPVAVVWRQESSYCSEDDDIYDRHGFEPNYYDDDDSLIYSDYNSVYDDDESDDDFMGMGF